MKVNLNGKEVTIGWRYHNPILTEMLATAGVSEDAVKSMTQPEIANALGLRQDELPKPTSVTCTVCNEDREIIMQASVKRYFKDPFSKEAGRYVSLKKLLDTFYAGGSSNSENKAIRRLFWEKYVSTTVLEKKQTKERKLFRRLTEKLEGYAESYKEVSNNIVPAVH